MKSKVLLIDDSVTIHRVIDLSIDVDRYDIVKVFSKEDAALKMQSEQYDYILLDNKLDNIIISEYIKELKAAQPSASIILLVGAFDRFDESDLEKTGADDYLVKPFDSQSLNEKLSSDADMMPAGIVEKIAEADFARDNDDYITPTASLTTGEVIDGLSKKEYLENLEEVQPDDLTDNGYAEDLDAAPSLEFDKLPKEAKEALQERQEENIQSEEQTEVDNPAESTIIEESPEEDIIVEENKEEEPVSVSLDDAAVETLSFEEPAVSEEVAEPAVEQEQETENIEEVNTADNEEVLDIPAAEENTQAEELSEQIVEEPALEVPAVEETAEDIPLTADAQEEENAPVNTEEIEIPDNMTAVHNPVLPDINDAADISDEYVMQDNLEEVDSISTNERLDEFPDFPDVDDISTDEMQDSQDTADIQAEESENTEFPLIEEDTAEELPADNILEENAVEEIPTEDIPAEETFAEESPVQEEAQAESEEESPAAENQQETLLVDDDDWLSDAPTAQEDNTADMQAEEPQLDLSEESADIENTADENISAEETTAQEATEAAEIPVEETFVEEAPVQEDIQEESAEEIPEEAESFEEPALFEENTEEESQDSLNLSDEETAPVEDVQETAEDTISSEPLSDELPEMPSLDEVSTMAESIDNAAENQAEDEVPVEDTAETLTAEAAEETVAEQEPAEETSFDMAESKAEEVAVNEERAEEEPVLPVQQEEVRNEPANFQQSEVKQAETYSPETSGRFGGITVTISRDEIIAMLGNAIDKHFLEEAVKEVIASNMKEIVRNIVPAIAEKYIKEEIERLKNDE